MAKLAPKALHIQSLLSRYNWYSAPHKYLRVNFNSFLIKLAKSDFNNYNEAKAIQVDFNELKQLLAAHAHHEDSAYHPLLIEDPILYHQAEQEHINLDITFAKLEKKLDDMELDKTSNDQRVLLGQEFHLQFTGYYADYLKHLINEETVFMPAMRKLHGVDKLRQEITFSTYYQMSAEDMVAMLSHLYPNLNFQEKAVLLLDIHDSDIYHQERNDNFKVKFPSVRQQLVNQNILSSEELSVLILCLE